VESSGSLSPHASKPFDLALNLTSISPSLPPRVEEMSVTTTTNARVLTSADYLSDYALHHTQPSSSEASPAPAPNAQDSPQPSSSDRRVSDPPADWETHWHRVPAYRPAQDQRDEMRTTYTSEVERNFVRVMFGGMYRTLSLFAFDLVF
jgi:hypothetical protein